MHFAQLIFANAMFMRFCISKIVFVYKISPRSSSKTSSGLFSHCSKETDYLHMTIAQTHENRFNKEYRKKCAYKAKIYQRTIITHQTATSTIKIRNNTTT